MLLFISGTGGPSAHPPGLAWLAGPKVWEVRASGKNAVRSAGRNQRAGVVAGWVLGTAPAPEMNQTRSTTAFDVTLANGSRERIDAEEVSVADISLMFSGAGQPDPYLRRCRKPWL